MNLNDAEKMARRAIREHLGSGWSFRWDNAKRRIGQCRWDRLSIQLSRPLVSANTVEEVEDTILHEIAHALVGAGHGHGPVWKKKARELGCQPTAASSAVALAEKPWRGLCACSHWDRTYYRRRKLHCRECGQPLRYVKNTAEVRPVRRPKPLPWSPKLDFPT